MAGSAFSIELPLKKTYLDTLSTMLYQTLYQSKQFLADIPMFVIAYLYADYAGEFYEFYNVASAYAKFAFLAIRLSIALVCFVMYPVVHYCHLHGSVRKYASYRVDKLIEEVVGGLNSGTTSVSIGTGGYGGGFQPSIQPDDMYNPPVQAAPVWNPPVAVVPQQYNDPSYGVQQSPHHHHHHQQEYVAAAAAIPYGNEQQYPPQDPNAAFYGPPQPQVYYDPSLPPVGPPQPQYGYVPQPGYNQPGYNETY